MHQSSIDKMQIFRDQYLCGREDEELIIYDLGSMDINGTYRAIFDSSHWGYVGMDMEPGNGVDLVLKNPYRWDEIKGNSVDIIISGQAFEHIELIWITMLEISRVLKPGGVCCIIAPSSGVEHKHPVDCWRIYPDGFTALANFAQLEVLTSATQWDEVGYSDGSDHWHDSTLICRKPDFKGWLKIKSILKTWLRLKAMQISIN
jgi:SAM-dependent methyltransferase